MACSRNMLANCLAMLWSLGCAFARHPSERKCHLTSESDAAAAIFQLLEKVEKLAACIHGQRWWVAACIQGQRWWVALKPDEGKV
jgi:hypothetical protein